MNAQHDEQSNDKVQPRRGVTASALREAILTVDDSEHGLTLAELIEMEESDDPAIRAKAQEITKTSMAPFGAKMQDQSRAISGVLASHGGLAAISRMQKDALAVGGAFDAVKGITDLHGKVGKLFAGSDVLAKFPKFDAAALVGPKVALFEVPRVEALSLPPMETHAADTAAATVATADAVVSLVQVAHAQHDQLGEMTAVLQRLVVHAEATRARQDAEAAVQARRFRIAISVASAALLAGAVAAVASMVAL